MKLVLYGGGDSEDTRTIDKQLIKLSMLPSPKVTFIPSYSYDADIDFYNFVMRFSKLGIKRFINFPIDSPFDTVLLAEAFTSDIIYLDGGNTYYFLNQLRKSKILPLLKEFAKKGGILAGLSAGAIIMTPNINTAGFPPFDCDINDERLRNFDALGLVPFEIFPHYKNSKRYNLSLQEYSKESGNDVLGCADGNGIIIDGQRVTVTKQITIFSNGKKFSKRTALKTTLANPNSIV